MISTAERISKLMKCGFILTLLLGVAGQSQVAMSQEPGAFTATGSMTTDRFGHSATELIDGRVLIAGGNGFTTIVTNSAELYDPSSGTFTATGSMTTARSGHAATLLPDGRVLIAGGNIGSSSAELYDPSSGTFSATGNMAAAHSLVILLNSGKVLMTGGFTRTPPWTAPNAEFYDPATDTFTAAGAYAGASPAWLLMATQLTDGRVLITGCTTDDSGYCVYGVDVAQIFDPATGTFSLTGACCYLESTATLLPNGKVLFAGGEIEVSRYSLAALYNPSTLTVTRTGDMTRARVAHTATLLPDGRVLIAGGGFETEPPYGTNQTAESYDPSAGAFTSIGNMNARRSYHAAALLKDGRVLIAGGVYQNTFDGGGTLSSAELYRPPILVPPSVLFSLSGDGRGQGAIWHADTGQIASSQNPAVVGEVLSMYTTGLSDGSMISPRVIIGGRLAEILFFGNAPGYPGFNQVNVRVPSGVAPGSAVPVRLTYLGRPSNEVSIVVK